MKIKTEIMEDEGYLYEIVICFPSLYVFFIFIQ